MGTVPQVAWLIAAVCVILSLGVSRRRVLVRRGKSRQLIGIRLALGATLMQ